MSLIEIDGAPQLLEGLKVVIRKEVAEQIEQNRPLPRTFTRAQTCKFLNCSLVTLDKFLREGLLRYQRRGRKIYIPETSIEDFVQGVKTEGRWSCRINAIPG